MANDDQVLTLAHGSVSNVCCSTSWTAGEGPNPEVTSSPAQNHVHRELPPEGGKYHTLQRESPESQRHSHPVKKIHGIFFTCPPGGWLL